MGVCTLKSSRALVFGFGSDKTGPSAIMQCKKKKKKRIVRKPTAIAAFYTSRNDVKSMIYFIKKFGDVLVSINQSSIYYLFS